MTVDPDRLGTARPKIEPETLEGTSAVLTIVSYHEDEVDDPSADGGKRPSAYLICKETGDLVLWLNKTMLLAICHHYGNDEKQWVGQPIPVEEQKGTAFGDKFHKVGVVPVDAWYTYIDGLEEPEPPAPKRATRKKTASRKRASKNGRRKRAKR